MLKRTLFGQTRISATQETGQQQRGAVAFKPSSVSGGMGLSPRGNFTFKVKVGMNDYVLTGFSIHFHSHSPPLKESDTAFDH